MFLNDTAPAATAVMTRAELALLLRAMLPAAAGKSEVRYYLRGVAFDLRGSDGLALAATDGHRMHWAQSLPAGEGPEVLGEGVAVLHTDDAARLLKRWGARAAKDTGTMVTIEVRPMVRTLSGTFTDSGKPEFVTHPATLRIDGEEFMCACGTDGRYPDYTRRLPRSLPAEAADVIGINAGYLADGADALRSLTVRGHVDLEPGDGNTPLHLIARNLDPRLARWSRAGAIIMPIRR